MRENRSAMQLLLKLAPVSAKGSQPAVLLSDFSVRAGNSALRSPENRQKLYRL